MTLGLYIICNNPKFWMGKSKCQKNSENHLQKYGMTESKAKIVSLSYVDTSFDDLLHHCLQYNLIHFFKKKNVLKETTHDYKS